MVVPNVYTLARSGYNKLLSKTNIHASNALRVESGVNKLKFRLVTLVLVVGVLDDLKLVLSVNRVNVIFTEAQGNGTDTVLAGICIFTNVRLFVSADFRMQ